MKKEENWAIVNFEGSLDFGVFYGNLKINFEVNI